jgi:EAL domain-containing protein (putative c-di-GMP-specific phosphodiesterase class I)
MAMQVPSNHPREPKRWTSRDRALQASPSSPPPDVRDLGRDDLDVLFQPIVSLRTGRTFAVEALTRCRVPGLESPLVLFDHAQQQHACGRLGRTIREVACERVTGKRVFLNLHPHELSARWLVRPDDPLCFHDHEVFLEITESAVLEYYDLCVSVLREVCARTGAHLVIDDLGAGFSNLKRIVDLQPSVVKLDRTLVAGLDRQPRQQVLVTKVVELCTALGARVVAEGIETVDELRAVIDTGAHFGQGYLLARPGWPEPPVSWPL